MKKKHNKTKQNKQRTIHLWENILLHLRTEKRTKADKKLKALLRGLNISYFPFRVWSTLSNLVDISGVMWCCGVMVITTAQLHSTKPKLRLCAGSNPARGVSEIRDGEDLWQWSRLEIRLNVFRRSTIPQKQFIIIIITLMAMSKFKQV